MKNAFNVAKAKIGTAVQNQTQRVASARDRARTRSSGGDDGLGASGASDGDAEALREAREHANALEKAQAALNGEMRRMAVEHDRLKVALETVSEEKETIRQRASAAWTEMTAEIEGLKGELVKARESVGADPEESAEQKKEKVHLEKHLKAIEKVLLEEREKSAATETSLKARIEELEALMAKGETETASNAESAEKVQELEAIISSLKLEITQKTSDVERLEASGPSAEELAALREEAAGASARVKDLETTLDLAKNELDETTSALEREEQNVAQLQKHESELVSQMNDLRESLEASQSSSSAEVQELRASKEALESQVSTLQSELESQSAALTQAQSSSSAEVQELRASKEALESQVSTLQSELESQSAALTQAQSSSSAEVQELRASKEALESQVSTLQSELESLRADVARLQGELEHKSHALQSLEESADAARTEMRTKLEESLHHAKEELRLVTEKSESHSASLSMDLESLKASLEATETRNAVMQEELRLTNEALSRSTNEAESMATLQAELADVSERHKETETEKLNLEESLRVANERLVNLEEKLKIAEENDASSAEALRNATEEAAKAKDNIASIASVSATQFAQERQMMKNALSELQTERDILVKMLKTFHTHGVVHSTTQTQQTGQAPDFAHRLAESASIAGVFTPQKKRTPYVDVDSPRSPT